MPRHRLEQVEGSKSVHAFGVFQGGSFSLKGKKKKITLSVCHLEVKPISFQVLAPVNLSSCSVKKNLALNPKI